MSAPERSDGVVSSATVDFDGFAAWQTVTDPVGKASSFAYSQVSGCARRDRVPRPGHRLRPRRSRASPTGSSPTTSGPPLVIAEHIEGRPTPTTTPSRRRGRSRWTRARNPGAQLRRQPQPPVSATEQTPCSTSASPDYRYTTEISNGGSPARGPPTTRCTGWWERDIVGSSDPDDDSDDVLVQTAGDDVSRLRTTPGRSTTQLRPPADDHDDLLGSRVGRTDSSAAPAAAPRRRPDLGTTTDGCQDRPADALGNTTVHNLRRDVRARDRHRGDREGRHPAIGDQRAVSRRQEDQVLNSSAAEAKRRR